MKQKLIVAAAVIAILVSPYIVIHSLNGLYQTGLSFGWDPMAAGLAAMFLTGASGLAALILVAVSFMDD